MDLSQYLNVLQQDSQYMPSDIQALNDYNRPVISVTNPSPHNQQTDNFKTQHPYLSRFGTKLSDFLKGFAASAGGGRDQWLENGVRGGIGNIQKAQQDRDYSNALQSFLPSDMSTNNLDPDQMRQIISLSNAQKEGEFNKQKWAQEYGLKQQEYGLKQQDSNLKNNELTLKQKQYETDKSKDLTTIQNTLNNALASGLLDSNKYQGIIQALTSKNIDVNSPIASTTANTMLTQMGIIPYRSGQLELGQRNLDIKNRMADIDAQRNQIQDDYNNGRISQAQAQAEWQKTIDAANLVMRGEAIQQSGNKPSLGDLINSQTTGQPFKPQKKVLSPLAQRTINNIQAKAGGNSVSSPNNDSVRTGIIGVIKKVLHDPNSTPAAIQRAYRVMKDRGISNSEVGI